MTELRLSADLELQAAAGDGKPRRIRIAAYGGGTIPVAGWGKVAIDLSGLEMSAATPILLSHENTIDALAAQGKGSVQAGGLEVLANIVPGRAGERLVELLAADVTLQASVGVEPSRTSYVGESGKVKVNGRDVPAGATIVHAGTLREVSVLPVGADKSTSVSIAARAAGVSPMNFESWLASLGIAATDDNRGRLEAEYGRLYSSTPTPTLSAAEREAQRREAIGVLADDFADRNGGTTGAVERIRAAADRGIAAGWDRQRAETEMIRASRPLGPGIAAQSQSSAPDLLTAALMSKAGFEAQAEKLLGATVMEQSRKLRGMSLSELCRQSLTWDRRDPPAGRDQMIRAAISSGSMPVALSNTADKILMTAYQTPPAAWRQFAAVKSTANFKPNTGIRPTFNNTLLQVPKGGDIKHADYNEETYEWKVDTYGRTLGISRTDFVNDDVGVFGEIIPSFAKAAARSLSNLVATVILANVGNGVPFWTLARKNYFEGAASALSSAALATAIKLLRQMKDSDGNLLDLQPAVLMVPPELEEIARGLLESAEILRVTTDGLPTGNIYKGFVALAVEPRLSDSGFAGSSATGWYLFSNPENAAVVVGFLDGLQVPTLETFGLDATIDQLAYRFRVYHDYGAALADFRAAVKSKGANGTAFAAREPAKGAR